MTYLLMASGPPHEVPSVKTIQKQYPKAQWIGVDRGVFDLLKHNIIPVQAFGDFDSITEKERHWIDETGINLNVFPREKDETDMEIALKWVLKQRPNQVVLLGATGGRLDHLFMNAHLILQGVSAGISIYIQDRWNKMTILQPGSYKVDKSSYRYVSLIPVTKEVKGLTLQGFRYPLIDATVKQGSSQCVSNEILGVQGEVSFTEGEMYFFETIDEKIHE